MHDLEVCDSVKSTCGTAERADRAVLERIALNWITYVFALVAGVSILVCFTRNLGALENNGC
jgi:hypothetical protein